MTDKPNERIEPQIVPFRSKPKRIPTPEQNAPIREIKLTRPTPDRDAQREFAELAARQAKRLNLANKPKIVFFIGRGKTGKTTNIRYLTSEMENQNVQFSILDVDDKNPVLREYFENTEMPESYEKNELIDWLANRCVAAATSSMHVLIDLGGGDHNLEVLQQEMPHFVSSIERCGGAVIACCTLGPSPDDLKPLASLHDLGFRPTGTALLLNESALPSGLFRGSFATIQSHSFYRELLEVHNAVPLVIPKLYLADLIEARRLRFDAASGQTTPGDEAPLMFHQQLMLAGWLERMREVYRPIAGWFQ